MAVVRGGGTREKKDITDFLVLRKPLICWRTMFLPDPLTTICGNAIFCEMGWDSLYFLRYFRIWTIPDTTILTESLPDALKTTKR